VLNSKTGGLVMSEWQAQRDRMMRCVGAMEVRESDAFIALAYGHVELASEFLVSALASGELALQFAAGCDPEPWRVENISEKIVRLNSHIASLVV
jgi:hypothetical protein